MRYMWFFLVSLLLACTPAKRPSKGTYTYTSHPQDPDANVLIIPTWIDSKFDYHMESAIVAAVREWNTVLNGRWRFEIQVSDKERKERQENEQISLYVKRVSARDVPFAGILGWFDTTTKPLEINIVGDLLNLPYDGWRTVTEHEIGHYLGLDHSEVRGTLMFRAYTTQGTCIDYVTVAALSDLHGWNPRYLNYCERQ